MKAYLTNKPLVLSFSDPFDSQASSKSRCHQACSAVHSYCCSVAIVAVPTWPLLRRASSPRMTFVATFVPQGETDPCSSPCYNSAVRQLRLHNGRIYYPHIIFARFVTCLKSCIKLRKAFALLHCLLCEGLVDLDLDLDREWDGFLSRCLESILSTYMHHTIITNEK